MKRQASAVPGLHVMIAGASWPPETFLLRLLSGLLDRGIELTIATRRRPDASWLSRPGFHWRRSDGGDASARLVRWTSRAARLAVSRPDELAALRRVLPRGTSRIERWQVWEQWLSATGGRWNVLYFPWNAGAISHLPLLDLGTPAVISCRGSQVNVAPHDPARAEIRDGLRLTFRKAAAVHCVSEAIREEALRYGLDPRKARVIHPAVDPDFFSPALSAPEDGRFRIVTAGTLDWRKGHEYALAALRRLTDRGLDAELTIVGEGPDRARLLYTIEDLGLSERVRLTGRIPPERVREELRRSHVFLLPSLTEGMSNAVLEGMACGLPIVTTLCGGMPEAVTEGVEGHLVKLRDASEMARVIEQLARQPERRAAMGAAARARVLRQFRIDQQVDQFAELFAAVRAIAAEASRSAERLSA